MKNERQGWGHLLTAFAVLGAMSGCGVSEEELAVQQGEPGDQVAQALQTACPSDLRRYRGQNGREVDCYCPSPSIASDAVWGTGTYTDDSSLCLAAVHAGYITLNGGNIRAVISSGINSYSGSARNGVTSSSYGYWPGSYRFSSPLATCPRDLTKYRGQNGMAVTCRCTSSSTTSGTVWGTSIYTDDSALCRAAVHAGHISSSGGNIRAMITGGIDNYRGSSRNGVKSLSYGSWPGSYYFW